MGRGEGTVGGGDFRNYHKGHMDKTKGKCGSKGGKWIWLEAGEEWWRENLDNCN